MSSRQSPTRRGRSAGRALLEGIDDVDQPQGTGYAMDMPGRARATGDPSFTPKNLLKRLEDLHMPHLPPTTPSSQPSSYSQSKSKSKSRSPSKSSSRSPSKQNMTGSDPKTIHKKEDLGDMSPAVTFTDIERMKGGSLSEPVINFWQNYMKLAVHEDEVVPEELRVSHFASLPEYKIDSR